ncbi:MAG TPA: carboxypeptidase regulatory-like domain-containing protein [Terriglobales bacterium]|nr:carboxypeptidase regulatory-like domain-containing protein [Terriglobales bacterium]
MKAGRVITELLTLLVLAVALTPSLMAQSLVSGDSTGTVTDPSGAVVSGAKVTLTSIANGATRTTTTNTNGAYRFALVPPGSYNVSVTAQGFSKADTTVNVNVGQATISDLKMAIGASSQTVEVTSAAPLVQADNADLSTNFNQTLIANQPNGGNDITYIAQTAPGMVMNTGQGFGNFSSYGLPSTSNLFTVNGENDMEPYLNVNNSGASNLTLGKNEIQEATVVNNAYSGQYGQQAGAQVSYVTKSGSNQFHGNAEYWWTGRAMNANDWFNNLNGTPRPFANNNQWAASIGGPIKKDKTFFFLNTEGLRYIVPSSTPVFAPSPNFINATLANLAANDPSSVPLYTRLFNLYRSAPGYNVSAFGPGDGGNCGVAIVGNCIGQYQATPALPGTEFIVSTRIDQNFSDADHVFWRVRIDQGTQATSADPINAAFNAASYQPAYDGQSQWNHVFGANATNQFIVAGSYYRSIFTQSNPQLFPYSLVSTGFSLTSVGGLVFDFPQGRNATQYQIVDDFSWTKGAHSLKFGANFRRYDITDYVFSVRNNPEVFIGTPVDLFNGVSELYRQTFPSRATEPIALWGLGVYGQDEWRVSRSLKLTLALRGEHNSNPVCQTNCAALLDSSFNALLATGQLTATTPYNSVIDANRHQIFRSTDAINISPRVGFAWSPRGDDKTVVRGGFGVLYDALPAVLGDQFMLNLPNLVDERLPNSLWADTTANGAAAQALASANAIKSGFANGASFASLQAMLGSAFRAPVSRSQAGTFNTPRYQQWSFGIQQALGDKSSVSVGYVGNHGLHIPVYNEGLNAFGVGYAPFPATAPTSIFGNVLQYSSAGVSNYNGLTASFNQRVTYGFSVQASYTWSHAVDEVSNNGVLATPFNDSNAAFSATPSNVQYQINPTCLRCYNYGNADYDVRNSFNASYVWQMPYKFGNKYVNGAFGGWTMSQNFFARSGLPFTVIDGNVAVGNYGPINPPAEVLAPAQQSCVNGLSECLNFNSFTSSTTTFPNQRRNGYRGPGFFDSDFSVNKNFKLTERMNFGIGANFYNIFNHPNFTNPDNNFADGDPANGGTFGKILTTTAPPTGPYGSFFVGLPSGRIIQFQGKLVF